MNRKIVRLDFGSEPARSGDGRGEREEPSDRYQVALDSDDLLVLRRSGAAANGAGRVLMAGEIVSPSTVFEVINVIASSRWVGTLQVFGADAHRVLGFARGVILHAKSDHPEDRLDKVLTRSRVMSPAQVESAMREIRPDQRLGEVLVERGVISRQQLFGYLERQAEEILLSAVLEEEGGYVFTVEDDLDSPPSATVHVPVQHLILTAAERVDTMSTYRRLIPSLDVRPEVEPGVEVTRLDPNQRLVLGYCNGERSLREIASETWLGRFEATATLYQLVRGGSVRLGPPRRTASDVAATLTEPFNELLREIYEAVDRWGDRGRAHRELRAWVEEDDERDFLRSSLNGDGLLDSAGIARALSPAAADPQVEATRHALHELTAFALFTASLWLPREVERELSRRVHERLKAIE